jgi:hypothetical protein
MPCKLIERAEKRIDKLLEKLRNTEIGLAETSVQVEQLEVKNEKLKEKIKKLELAEDLTLYTKEQLQENERLREFIDKLRVAEITFQPDLNKAWETITVKEIIGSDRRLELANQALKGK